MINVDPRPDGKQEQQATALQASVARRPLFPAIRWGAVLAGVAVGVSVQLVLALLGIATGLSALDIEEGDSLGATGPLVWAGLSMLIAAFVGGYVAARMSNLKRRADGILHGAVSWAVTTLMFATLATSVTGSVMSGILGTVNPIAHSTVVQQGNGAGSNAADSPVLAMLRQQIGTDISGATLQRVQRDIDAGQRDDAIRTLTETGITPARAATIVDQALIASGSAERASPQAREAADEALANASRAAWGVFLAVALSLALGTFGGALGAAGSRRRSWTDSNMAHA